MSSSRREKFKPMAQINVVPYIDVMLVLLVIFMITAPLMNPGQIDLPSVGQSLAPPQAPLELIVREDATLALRDRKQGEKEWPVSRDQLPEIVRAHLSSADQSVVIAADKDVRYEEVVKVMAALRQADIKKVGLLTKTQ